MCVEGLYKKRNQAFKSRKSAIYIHWRLNLKENRAAFLHGLAYGRSRLTLLAYSFPVSAQRLPITWPHFLVLGRKIGLACMYIVV